MLNSDMDQVLEILTSETQDLSIRHSQYHGFWCPGVTRLLSVKHERTASLTLPYAQSNYQMLYIRATQFGFHYCQPGLGGETYLWHT